MASISTTFTVKQTASTDLYLAPGESLNVILTRTGSGSFAVVLEERIKGTTYAPIQTFTADTAGTTYANAEPFPRYFHLLCTVIEPGDSIASTLADVAGESLPGYPVRNDAGAVVFDVTDTGVESPLFTGPLTGDSTGTHTGAVVGDVTGDVTGNVGAALAAPGAGIGAARVDTSITREGDFIVTRIYVDVTGLASAAAGDVVGLAAGGAAFICRILAASGTIVGGTLRCFEAPATGEADIDVYSATAATAAYNDAISGVAGQTQAINSGTLALTTDGSLIPDTVVANDYLYLVSVGAAADTYTAGRILITLYGI